MYVKYKASLRLDRMLLDQTPVGLCLLVLLLQSDKEVQMFEPVARLFKTTCFVFMVLGPCNVVRSDGWLALGWLALSWLALGWLALGRRCGRGVEAL